MRVDPAQVLGIKPGEAVVIRNIGGRVRPGLLDELGRLGRIGEVAKTSSERWQAVSLDRTSSYGLRKHASGGRSGLAGALLQIPEKEVESKSVRDPRKAMAVDVAALRAIPALPDEWLVSRLVYDVATGLVEVVVPATPIRGAKAA